MNTQNMQSDAMALTGDESLYDSRNFTLQLNEKKSQTNILKIIPTQYMDIEKENGVRKPLITGTKIENE